MNNSEFLILFAAYFVGIPLCAVLFLIVLPIVGYLRGKKINNAGKYGSVSLIIGGVLFVAYMMWVGYLESGPFNYSHSGAEGMIPGLISTLGIASVLIGLLWRIIVGFKKA